MADAATALLRMLSRFAGARVGKDRRRAAAVGDRLFPGRLTVLQARSLFPMVSGSEVVFGVRDDPDAVVRVRVEGAGPGEADLRAAVARGLAGAEEWRRLKSAFTDGGYEVYGLGRNVARPWVSAEVSNGTVAELLARIGECVARWAPGERGGDVFIAPPEVVRTLRPGDPKLPALLSLASDRRLAALCGGQPYHRVSYGRDGRPGMSLIRPFAAQQAYEEAVQASTREWLAHAFPGARVTGTTGCTRLAPGRADRIQGYLTFTDGPVREGEGRSTFGDHALLVTADLSGSLCGTPTVLRDARDPSGALQLPPL